MFGLETILATIHYAQLPPARNGRRNPNKSVEQIGGQIFQQNRFPVPGISVPGPKHSFHLVAL